VALNTIDLTIPKPNDSTTLEIYLATKEGYKLAKSLV
jgi:hypothetical protein